MKSTLLYFALLFCFIGSARAQSSVPLSVEVSTPVVYNPGILKQDPTATTVPDLSERNVTNNQVIPIENPNAASTVYDRPENSSAPVQPLASSKVTARESGYRKSERPAPALPNEKYVRDETKPGIPLPRETYHR